MRTWPGISRFFVDRSSELDFRPSGDEGFPLLGKTLRQLGPASRPPDVGVCGGGVSIPRPHATIAHTVRDAFAAWGAESSAASKKMMAGLEGEC